MTNRSSGPGGFSLIEVVVAMVIIAVGVLMVPVTAFAALSLVQLLAD